MSWEWKLNSKDLLTYKLTYKIKILRKAGVPELSVYTSNNTVLLTPVKIAILTYKSNLALAVITTAFVLKILHRSQFLHIACPLLRWDR